MATFLNFFTDKRLVALVVFLVLLGLVRRFAGR